MLPNADSSHLFHGQKKKGEKKKKRPRTKERPQVEFKLKITLSLPPTYIFIGRLIIANTYIALNSAEVRPDVRLLYKMGP